MSQSQDTSSTLSVTNYLSSEAPEKLLLQYGQMRYRCFSPDDPNVSMDNQRQVEFDQFDINGDTRYIMITATDSAGNEKLVSAMRFIPTLSHYDLEQDSYRYLTAGCELPKCKDIIETSRWVGESTRTANGELILGLMNRETCMWGRANGYRAILGVVNMRFEDWFLSRNITIKRCSPLHEMAEGGTIAMVQIELDDSFLAAANQQIVNAISSQSLSSIRLTSPVAA